MRIKQGIDWEKFDPEAYINDNYSYLHEEDRQILDILIPFYKKNMNKTDVVLDIGTGPNIYPLLAIVPFVAHIDCLEYSKRNIEFLKKELKSPGFNWKCFLSYMQKIDFVYRISIKRMLDKKISLYHDSIFTYRKYEYDCVTMFFVAESITNTQNTFIQVCRKFVDYCKNHGLLIAVFMENFTGYSINSVRFPSYPVNQEQLAKIFMPFCLDINIQRIKKADVPLRKGYTGMLLLTAKKVIK